MNRITRRWLGLFLLLGAVVGVLVFVGCRPTSHPVVPASLGRPASFSELEASLAVPGPMGVESVVAADWEVERGGLINLEHDAASGLHDGVEPIQIYFHALRHPTHGLYIIDTGVERALRDDPERAAIRGLVADVMNVDRMRIVTDTASWLAAQPDPLAGVLLTHLHLDHISGLPDVPRGTPLYAGPGETDERAALNVFVAPVIDRALAGHAPIGEWRFDGGGGGGAGGFAGIVDVFGDQSLWALWVPGHTAGSTAYLARTADGPVLFVGDASHTAWGWSHQVEPGSFSTDRPRSAQSLAALRGLVERHPQIDVRLGHQHLDDAVVARTARR